MNPRSPSTRSRVSKGDPFSPFLFDIIIVVLIYDVKSLNVEWCLLLYADAMLFCLLGRGAQQGRDLRAALYQLGVFGYFSGLRVNPSKTYGVVQGREGEPKPATVVGLTVKEHVKFLDTLLGNVSCDTAYVPVIAKLMARARSVAALPLGMEEKAFLFALWIAPVCYLTAQVYRPTEHVCTQLDLVHRIALGLNTWHLTMPILQLPPSEGGTGQASPSTYAPWVHNHTFVSYVLQPERFAERHAGPFRRWSCATVLCLRKNLCTIYNWARCCCQCHHSCRDASRHTQSSGGRGGGLTPPPPVRNTSCSKCWCGIMHNWTTLTYHCTALVKRGGVVVGLFGGWRRYPVAVVGAPCSHVAISLCEESR